MKSHWVEYKGKRIFLAEFSGFGADAIAFRQEANEIIVALQNEPPNSVISISNVSGTTASLENIKVLRALLPRTNKQVYKRCVIGITGLRWYFVDMLNEFTGQAKLEMFSSLVEAMDWIVQD